VTTTVLPEQAGPPISIDSFRLMVLGHLLLNYLIRQVSHSVDSVRLMVLGSVVKLLN
jgi:hypothetical protein